MPRAVYEYEKINKTAAGTDGCFQGRIAKKVRSGTKIDEGRMD